MSRRELMRSSSVILLNCLHRVVEGDASKSICHFLMALAHKADTLSWKSGSQVLWRITLEKISGPGASPALDCDSDAVGRSCDASLEA